MRCFLLRAICFVLVTGLGIPLAENASAFPSRGANCASCHGPVPSVTPSNRTLAFGNVLVGSTKNLALRITDVAPRHVRRNFTMTGSFPGGPAGTNITRIGAASYSGVVSTGTTFAERTYTFAPSVRGTVSGNGMLTANSGEPSSSTSVVPDFTIMFSGKGVAPVSESSGAGNAGNVRVGTTGVATKTLKNIGDGNLSGAGASSNLRGSLSALTGVFEAGAATISLADAAEQNFNFTFRPTARGLQTTTASVPLTNGSANGANLAHTLSWSLSGTGVGPDFDSDVPPGTTIDFGSVPLGGEATRSLRVSNVTTDGELDDLTDLTVLLATLEGTNAGNYSVPGFSPQVIPAGGFVSLDLLFSAGQISGLKNAALVLTTDEGAAKGQPGATFRFDLAGAAQASFLAGDFDENSTVDSADLARWGDGFGLVSGATRMLGDADANGNSDGADFLTWQRQFGAATTVAVPEPQSLTLCVGLLVMLVTANRQRCQ